MGACLEYLDRIGTNDLGVCRGHPNADPLAGDGMAHQQGSPMGVGDEVPAMCERPDLDDHLVADLQDAALAR